MLEFFRKYQKFFFYIITVVIVVSFSFFGTFNTIPAIAERETVAFTAVDGTEVMRSDLENLVVFIATDSFDRTALGIWGPNFLNDGVIRKDFLETGLAAQLAGQYMDDIGPELAARLEKEKRYRLYTHPQAKFIGTETVWRYFAPYMTQSFEALRASKNAADPEAIEARINLFIGEKRMPPALLYQMLRYQEKQYNWIASDPNLDRTDLSLFGYHTLDDWFGAKFVRVVAEFIINSAILAEEKGYKVSQSEALADLQRNAAVSYQQVTKHQGVGVANRGEYFSEQLRRLGMDQNKAAKVWRQVLLFRRLFHSPGQGALVDRAFVENLHQYANESVELDVYRLPEALRLKDFRSLQKFEAYIDAVAKGESKPLALPKAYQTAQEVAKGNPELVQKKYLLDVAHVDKGALKAKVLLKDMWNWQVEDKNWEKIQKQFPDLAIKKAGTRDERFAALDKMDSVGRSRLDAFSRGLIVDEHPEWVDQALSEAEAQRLEVGIPLKGGNTIFVGLDNADKLISLLDKEKQVDHFTSDNKNFYKIVVLDRSPQQQIMTFAEANQAGVLDKLVDRALEKTYEGIRAKHADVFQTPTGEWKSFADVKDRVADLHFASLLEALQKEENSGKPVTGEAGASLRLAGYLRQAEGQLQKNPENAAEWVHEVQEQKAGDKIAQQDSLKAQWKLEKTPYRAIRSTEPRGIDHAEAFRLNQNDWSQVYTPANGDLYFYQVVKKGAQENASELRDRVMAAQQQLSDEVQRKIMVQILELIKDKGAISLNYMNRAQVNEMTNYERPAPMDDY